MNLSPRSLLFLLLFASSPLAHADEPAHLQLTLPPAVYAVAGDETSISFDNIVLMESTTDLRFQIDCDLGQATADRWSLTPKESDCGTIPLQVSVADSQGNQIAQATTRLHIVSATASRNQPLRILLVGDSLTHASLYPNELARLLARPGNPQFKFLGTHKPPQAAENVAHEGYGGWTWARFATHYEPDPDGTHRKRSSPFVLLNAESRPELNVKQYLAQHSPDAPPDVVLFLLGINDCFSADPENPAAIDARIDAMLKHAQTLLAAFREAAPQADLGICLTTPPNARASAFEANYQDRYHRWGWKRIQHRLVQRELQHVGAAEDDRLFVVPTQLNLDPVAGYPEGNAVHPNPQGYRQIAGSIYAWLKWRMMQPR